MNVLLIDTDRCGLDLALRCVEYGHVVRWYEQEGHESYRDGDGFPGIEKVKDWRQHMKWAKDGLIWVSSNAYFMAELDEWREFGFKIFGPTKLSASYEVDRNAGMQLMEKCGIQIPPYEMFDSLQAARKRAMQVSEPMVFKTMGDEADKSMTYVARDPADMVARIDRWIEKNIRLKGQCMLQEKIEGVEMGISCWFGPDGPLKDKWNINFEHKKLMPGNYGPNTGEMGTVIQYVRNDKIAEVFNPKLVDAFKAAGHTGDLDLNCMIDRKGGVWPMEFTCRPGWPYDWISDAVIHSDPAQWRRDLLDGKDSLRVAYACSIGEVIAVPPFPYDVHKNSIDPMGLMIESPDDWTGLHPVCMMIEDGPAMRDDKIVTKPVTKSSGDYVMVLTGVGDTVRDAQKSVRALRDKVHVSNMIVRNDIGDGMEKCLTELHALGFAEEMEY